MERQKTQKTNIKTTVPVKGMHCASCSNIIERTLKKVEGVVNVEVNYATEKAKIIFDPSKIVLEDLSKKIEPYGYSLEATPLEKQEKNTQTLSESAEMETINHTPIPLTDKVSVKGIDRSELVNQKTENKQKELNEFKKKVTFSLPISIFVFVSMMWDIASKSLSRVPEFFIPMSVYSNILFILATIVLFWVGKVYIDGFIRFLKYRVANMDTLVGLGTLTAYFYSSLILLFPQIAKTLGLQSHLYFDVTIVVIGFITFGKFLEARSKLRTGEAIEKLLGMQAKSALVERENGEIEIPVDQVIKGDVVLVKPGSKIPVDGEIIEGRSSIDESMVSGEPIPVDKKTGDTVIGGTINKQGSLKFVATKVGSETLLSHIIQMVEEAQGSRAPIQKLADKISGIFVPVVLGIAIVALLAWMIIGSRFMPFDQAFSLALVSFVSILVIACPCALGLATPTGIIVGVGKGATNGILIKNAESLEKLYKVNTLVVDKTGTITKGKPEVTDIKTVSVFNEEKVLSLLGALEKNSEHPLASAIMEKVKEKNVETEPLHGFENIEGKGVKGSIEGVQYYAGNVTLIEELAIKFDRSSIEGFTSQGKTPVLLANKEKVLAIIAIADTLKDEAKKAVEDLHKLGIRVVMLTGDNKNTAKYISDQIGIDEVFAEVLPNDKAKKIKELQAKGRIVGMAGDGVNDAPALALADVGIAMGTGTDVAIESADITLLGGDISRIAKAFKLSRITMTTIKQNLFWAFIYNVVGIPLAAGLFYPIFGWMLNPAFAGLAMAFSSVSVVLNSLRLKTKKL